MGTLNFWLLMWLPENELVGGASSILANRLVERYLEPVLAGAAVVRVKGQRQGKAWPCKLQEGQGVTVRYESWTVELVNRGGQLEVCLPFLAGVLVERWLKPLEVGEARRRAFPFPGEVRYLLGVKKGQGVELPVGGEMAVGLEWAEEAGWS